MVKSTRKIVMPAIYQFTFEKSPKQSKWGWHNTAELVEAINTILVSSGRKPMSTQEIVQEFQFIDPHCPNEYFGSSVIQNSYYYIVNESGQLFKAYHGDGTDWLDWSKGTNSYLPAKIGMKLLNAVKHPIRAKIKSIVS